MLAVEAVAICTPATGNDDGIEEFSFQGSVLLTSTSDCERFRESQELTCMYGFECMR